MKRWPFIPDLKRRPRIDPRYSGYCYWRQCSQCRAKDCEHKCHEKEETMDQPCPMNDEYDHCDHWFDNSGPCCWHENEPPEPRITRAHTPGSLLGKPPRKPPWKMTAKATLIKAADKD